MFSRNDPGRDGENDNEDRMMRDRDGVVALLKEQAVEFELYEHEPITSVEESKQLGLPHEGAGTKNFFLRDKKKRNYFVITTKEDKQVDLKQVRELLGTSALSFASEEDLDRILGVITGAVGPFAVLNDTEHMVKVYIDEEFRGEWMDAHPNDNAATLFLHADDVVKVLRECGSTVEYIEL